MMAQLLNRGKRGAIVAAVFVITMMLLVFVMTRLPRAEEALIINDADWPPFFFAGKQEVTPGIGREVLENCFKGLGFPFEFRYHPIKRMRLYVDSGKIDLNIYSYKKEREEYLVYGGEPLYSTSYRPFVLKESYISIKTLQDFDNLNIGHLAGLSYSDWFLKYIEGRLADQSNPKKVFVVNTNESLILMLLKKRIDVFVEAKETIWWLARQLEATDSIKMLDFDVRTCDYFLTVSKKSEKIKDKKEFLDRIDTCVKELKEKGLYEEILLKYNIH